jgi:hypothetical protein
VVGEDVWQHAGECDVRGGDHLCRFFGLRRCVLTPTPFMSGSTRMTGRCGASGLSGRQKLTSNTRIPSVLLRPLGGHLSASLGINRLLTSSRGWNLDCDRDCDRPLNLPRSRRRFGPAWPRAVFGSAVRRPGPLSVWSTDLVRYCLTQPCELVHSSLDSSK